MISSTRVLIKFTLVSILIVSDIESSTNKLASLDTTHVLDKAGSAKVLEDMFEIKFRNKG